MVLMNEESKSVLVFFLFSVVAGIISSLFSNTIGVVLGATILVLLSHVMSKIMKKDLKWFLGNGIIIYIFFWIMAWTIVLGF